MCPECSCPSYVLCVVCVSRAGASAERAGGQRGGSTVAPSRQAHAHPCPDRAHVVNAALRAVQLFHRKPRVTQIISTSLFLVELLLCSVAERAGRYFLRDFLGLSEFQLRLASLRVVCAMSRLALSRVFVHHFSLCFRLLTLLFCAVGACVGVTVRRRPAGGSGCGAVPAAPPRPAGAGSEGAGASCLVSQGCLGRIVRNISNFPRFSESNTKYPEH
jgi:hypothetical protein